jgi:hypothetical protein
VIRRRGALRISDTKRVMPTRRPPEGIIVLNVNRQVERCRPKGRITRGWFVLGLAAAVTIGAATPALADELDVAGPDQAPTTETPEQQRAREHAEETLRTTIGKAKLLLFREGPCRDHFGTSTTAYAGQDALAVLGNLQIDGKIVNSFDTPGPTAENGPAPAEFDPNTGTITVYKDFFDTSANSQVETGRNQFVPPLSTEDFQVLVLLHELDHVFGKRHENTGDSPRKFNDALAQACLNSSLPPDPPSPPGGGFAVGDGANSPSYTVPQYVFVDPLPDGEGDVTIGEITDCGVEPGEPEPLPDDVDPDDPCAIDPLGCAYDGWGGGLYDGGPYDGGVYGGGFDDYGQYDDGSYYDGPYADYDLSEYAY